MSERVWGAGNSLARGHSDLDLETPEGGVVATAAAAAAADDDDDDDDDTVAWHATSREGSSRDLARGVMHLQRTKCGNAQHVLVWGLFLYSQNVCKVTFYHLDLIKTTFGVQNGLFASRVV